jgi:rhodanese-related sulfurtransferase
VSTQNALRQILLLLVLAAIPATGAALFHPRRPSWKAATLASDEILLQTALNENDRVLWLDARQAADFQKDHIPGAMLLNEDDWDDLLPPVLRVWRRGMILVVYCNSQRCQSSGEVAKRLREEAGLPDVYVLKGGWDSWLTSKK